ncbi:MAG: hypothetical protein M3Y91_16750, partial [Actinomycetota bacterium]|nr:hypothetical protein [Actinomycetota bacterium]
PAAYPASQVPAAQAPGSPTPAPPPAVSPAAASPTAASRPAENDTDRAETAPDRETQERWARLAAADVGDAGGSPRRRRSRVFRDTDRPRRPLRSTQEANAVAARRKEQITGTSPDASAPEPADPAAAASASATAGDAPSDSTPTIRVPRSAAATEGHEVSGTPPGDEGRHLPAGTSEEWSGSAPGTSPATTGAAGSIPAGATNGSAATQPAGSGNGTTPAGADDEREAAGDDETHRRGLRRRGRSKRKSGEG